MPLVMAWQRRRCFRLSLDDEKGPSLYQAVGEEFWTSKTRHVWQFPTKDTNGCAWSWQFQYSKWLLTAGFAMFPLKLRHAQYVAHIPTWTHYEPNIIQYIHNISFQWLNRNIFMYDKWVRHLCCQWLVVMPWRNGVVWRGNGKPALHCFIYI